MRPAAHLLFFASPKKSRQKKGDPKSATPPLRCGANLRRGAGGVRCGTHCAPAALRSDNRSESDHEAVASCGATATPPAPRRRRSPRGKDGTGHRCARPRFFSLFRLRERVGVRVSRAERSDGPLGFQCPSGRAEKRRAWGGPGQRSMPRLRALTCCGCLSAESAANEASSAAPPQARASQVARSEAKGHGQWGRLSLPTFFGEAKKVGRPPGRIPGLDASRHKPVEPSRPSPCARIIWKHADRHDR